MTFAAPFGRIIRPPFGPAISTAAAVASWWLSGGVTAAQCDGAYLAKGAASLAASYFNLNAPGTHDLTLGTAPAWDAAGWAFTNALSQYLKTGIIPGSGHSAIVWFSGVISDQNRFLFGSWDSAGKYYGIRPSRTVGTLSAQYSNGGGLLAVAPQLLSGSLGYAGQTGYRNGVADAGTIPGPAVSDREHYVGALNLNGSPFGYITAVITAICFYNITLSGPQMLAIYTAGAAL